MHEFIQLKTQVPPNQPPMPVRWIDGIVFQFAGYSPTDEIVNDNLQGIVNWSVVEFAEMPYYKPVLVNQATGVSVSVMDNSANTAVADFIRWLKKQGQWFPMSPKVRA